MYAKRPLYGYRFCRLARLHAGGAFERGRRPAASGAFVQLVLLVALFFGMLLHYTQKYTAQPNNVATASVFNQSFKEDIDLKIYDYVIGSYYSEGLPMAKVENAQALAGRLMVTTTPKDSSRAINNVLNLCENLKSKIVLIEQTESYNERQVQLENNIYILTALTRNMCIPISAMKRRNSICCTCRWCGRCIHRSHWSA